MLPAVTPPKKKLWPTLMPVKLPKASQLKSLLRNPKKPAKKTKPFWYSGVMAATAKTEKPASKWFHPQSLLDKTYEIGILIKGIDGALELLGALLLVVVPASAITRLTHFMVDTELAHEPNSFIATHVLHLGTTLAAGHNTFAILFLLTHGAVKVGLVVALLRQKLWAYPLALVALAGFLVYQVYLLITQATFGMAFLTVLDVVIIWLVWREWQKVRPPGSASPQVSTPL
jgi:uncharacterized membrane protein